MSVLDSIDTTVTLEWQGARTIGTLIELGGRTAVLTALRTPDKGDAIHIVVEGDLPEETVTIDGACRSVAETAWGEQQAEVELMRVGTTQSASRLRDFIEEYGILRGGSVHIGRNRDNPNRKRFVYHLPEISETLRKDKKHERQRRATISGMRQTSPERGGGQPTVVPPSGPVRRKDPSFAIAAELADMSAAPYVSSTPTVSGPPRSHPSMRMAMSGVSRQTDSGFDEDPGDPHPDFDSLADAFMSATSGVGPDLGFDGPAMRSNPDVAPADMPTDSPLAVTDELDQALREALDAVEQPRAVSPSAFENTERAPSFEPTSEVDDIPAFAAMEADEFGGGDADDPFSAGMDFDDLPPAVPGSEPDLEVGSAVMLEEVEPTRIMDAVSDEREPAESIKSTANYGSVDLSDAEDRMTSGYQDVDETDGDLDEGPPEDLPEHVSEELIAKIDDAIALERAFSDSEYHDPEEPIIVNTVAHGVPFADPVKLGHDNQVPSFTSALPLKSPRAAKPKKKKAKRKPSGGRQAVTTDTLQRPQNLGKHSPSSSSTPAAEEQLGSLNHRMLSDSLVKVQTVFGVDMAIRCDLPVIFGSGRSKRQGQLLRLAESRLRIASDHQPGLYERLNVLIPDPAGGKAKINLDCEVTRIREPDDDEEPIAFDMRLAGSNSPKQMQALRKLIRSFDAPPA